MQSIWLILIAVIGFSLAYIFYGRFLSKRLKVNSDNPTPAHTMTDGIDYVPAKAPVLLGHHFASIAGASPIIGPITAAVFGWIPVFVWIVLGAIFIGGVHDFTSIMASVRHRSRSIGVIIHEHIGDLGKKLFIIFAWSTLVLVIAVFAILVARTFVMVPASATSSVFFLFLAVVFGISIYRFKVPLGIASVVGVAFLLGGVGLGIILPLNLSFTVWIVILLGYIIVASVTPVWILLQPRDYLNSFLLYILVGAASLGIIFGNPEIHLEGFTSFKTNIGYLFPLLFVTVACGAVSGFHSLVGSGTTSKQLDKESDARIVGYGGMLMEGLLAVIALIAAAAITSEKYHEFIPDGGGPIALFSTSVGNFISTLGIPANVGTTFSALAISAFALTTLDTATRLARFSFQEFFEKKGEEKQSLLATNRYIATAVGAGFAGALALSGEWQAIWPIFGSANQLLAAIALLAVSVWLSRSNIKNGFTLYPMFFMFAVTIFALVLLIFNNFQSQNYLLMAMAVGLLFVAIVLATLAFNGLRKKYQVAEK
jgi:carbon starvation protein